MKILQLIELVLNCLSLAVEMWESLEKYMPIFKAFTLFFN